MIYFLFLFLSTAFSLKTLIPIGIKSLKSFSHNENNHYMKFNDYFKKNEAFQIFNNLIQQELKHPIILSSSQLNYNEDLCRFFSNINNIEFMKYTFDDFMLELPYVNNQNCLIFVEDFLIKNGRILNQYEEFRLQELDENSNLIVFNSNELDTVPFKDINIIRRFKNIKLKTYTNKDLIHYINYVININNYDDNLYLINWKKYDLQNLSFEKINMLLFELDRMLKEKQSFDILEFIDLMLNNL